MLTSLPMMLYEDAVAPPVVVSVKMIADTGVGNQFVDADLKTVHTSSSSYRGATADKHIMPSDGGVWQFEATVTSQPTGLGIGIATQNPLLGAGYLGEASQPSFCFNPTNAVLEGTLLVVTSPPNPVFSLNDVVGVVVDFDANQVKLYRNGTLLITVGIAAASIGSSQQWRPAICDVLTAVVTVAVMEFNTMQYPVAGASPWEAGAHP